MIDHRNFLPVVKTLVLNTGLDNVLLMPWKGFIIDFTQTSYTSVKNSLTASSVCGLVGLVGIVAALPAPVVAEARARSEDDGAEVVYEAYGGNMWGFCPKFCKGGTVFGGWGRWSRRNFVEVGVRKHDI